MYGHLLRKISREGYIHASIPHSRDDSNRLFNRTPSTKIGKNSTVGGGFHRRHYKEFRWKCQIDKINESCY